MATAVRLPHRAGGLMSPVSHRPPQLGTKGNSGIIKGGCAERKFQARSVLNETARRLAISSLEDQQALLTVWGDLFRLGVLAWGYDLSNPSPPFMHLTEVGRRTLSNLSRDPYNPEGYLAAVRPLLAPGSVALSYLEEGVNTRSRRVA